MRSCYPDYKRISQIKNELNALPFSRNGYAYDYDEECRLKNELLKLVMGEPIEVAGKFCNTHDCRRGPIYYPGRVHHLDGNQDNNSFGNLAMVCPSCKAHILLSRFGPQEIWRLKISGLSNAEIGRLLGISRERVRQLSRQFPPKLDLEIVEGLRAGELVRIARRGNRTQQEEGQLKAGLDRLAEIAQRRERSWKGKGRRLTDKRTLRKRILAALTRLETHQEGGTK